MSRSKRKNKSNKRPLCTCWLCDPHGRRKEFKIRKMMPDTELAKEIRDTPSSFSG